MESSMAYVPLLDSASPLGPVQSDSEVSLEGESALRPVQSESEGSLEGGSSNPAGSHRTAKLGSSDDTGSGT